MSRRNRWQLLLAALLLLVGQVVHAQTCSAAPTNINFGNVNPISGAAVSASGSITVTCNWTLISLAPNAQVCLNLNASTPLSMTNGSNALQYGLYQDAANSIAWGSTSAGTTPISVTIAKPLIGTSANHTVSYYGLITASQPLVPTASDSSTVYSQSFSGAQTALNYAYYLLTAPGCPAITTPATAFPFTASATVVNDCLINANNLSFGTTGLLSSAINATTSISVTCTNNDAYRIALNGGGSGNVSARTLSLQGGGGTVSYQLYLDSAHGTPWGDGTAGTSMYTDTGTGAPQSATVYGLIPAQTTPPPGNYSDTITATIAF
ncbi:spore coat U domain-containing protein [Dyella sp. M7H15-1]|uniref:Csu type fimbrial protein n=1 Tax=Dyella sp. M7H15-1 TaxID=2501295 RepID=UPI001004FFAA|nr:spore coat U domain-containing protein [Dyella sp. M7H15-1]QAU22574.1 spore coat U domain-containing protein [Dyella sp. M7H15-1]